MTTAYRGARLHIAVLGRCNTGKSTVLNHITGQEAAIVSPRPGTTGDPVPLAFELLPVGPVTFYDTAGLDEDSELGILRREAGQKVLAHADLALVVTDEHGIGPWERDIADALKRLGTPFLLLFNKEDLRQDAGRVEKDMNWCKEQGIPFLSLCSLTAVDPAPVRQAIIALAPEKGRTMPLVTDLLAPGAAVVCVTPIDASAPAGRLIAPQVQVLRELVEARHPAMTIQPGELHRALHLLREAPGLVITDSQAVLEAAASVPPEIPLTTFSMLFARQKGDFTLLLEGTRAMDHLAPGARVLIAEACSHHAQDDDIARVKIPALLRKHAGHGLDFFHAAGGDFPGDLSRFALAVHCGGCMLNQGEMRRRLRLCAASGVPCTNFGMAISKVQGLLERVAAPLIRENDTYDPPAFSWR